MLGLSAVIFARDRDQDVARALRSASFADEVLVMDSSAADRPLELSRPRGVRVICHAFDGQGSVGQRAATEARHDWLLFLDADEEVTEPLAAAVMGLLAGEPPRCAAYRVRLVTAFMGRPLSHGAGSTAHPVRLFDRRRAAWSSAPLQAEASYSGKLGRIHGTLLHHAREDLSDAILEMNAETSLTALELALSGRRRGGPAIALAAMSRFLRLYVLGRGYLDGLPGLAWSFTEAVGLGVRYLKAEELMGGVAGTVSGPRQRPQETPVLPTPGATYFDEDEETTEPSETLPLPPGAPDGRDAGYH